MIGDRIKQARKASGLSLRALAEKAGISAMAISKYEQGKSTPSSGVVLSLAKNLGVRSEYFFRQSRVELKDVDYRKHDKLPKKVLDQIQGDVIEQIERFIDLEQVLPVNPICDFKLSDCLPNKINDIEQVEACADCVRRDWGIGSNPIPDLIDSFEERGIKVFQSSALHDEKFDGLAATVNGYPIVVIGRDWPGDRQRFTLAHELGHLVLKNRLDGIDEEKAANRFAGAFLVPASEAIKELGDRRSWLEPVELCVLKKTYGLSMRGWIYRASDLKILNKSDARKMWEYFRSRQWVKKEPGDRYPSESPKLFIQLVFHAYAEEIINESKAAELLGKSLTEFRKIRNIGSCEQDTAY